MTLAVATQQVLLGRPATITTTWVDQYGEPGLASGSVAVTVVDHLGAVVATAVAATHDSQTGEYLAALPAVTRLDLLRATWTDGSGATTTTTVEVVGGFYFSIADALENDPQLDMGATSVAQLRAVRRAVEEECERICRRAFVPRFRIVEQWGSGTQTLRLPSHDLRAIRSVSVDGTPLDTAALGQVVFTGGGDVTRSYIPALQDAVDDWSTNWLQRFPAKSRVSIAYEHGLDRPPHEVRDAALTRFRDRLAGPDSPVPDRADRYDAGGASYAIAPTTPGGTGIPSVDAVYGDWTVRGSRVASPAFG